VIKSKGIFLFSVVWLLFVALTLASAFVDIVSYRIPNTFVLALIGIFAIVALLHRSEVHWLSHLGAFMLVLGAGMFLYAFGQMGAGDVKLLSALALWAGIYALVGLLFWVSLCGLVGMLVILALRALVTRSKFFSESRPVPRVLTKRQGIPYGIGIGPGAIVASFSFPFWLWLW
jgi:prepilin peptidase CpaA